MARPGVFQEAHAEALYNDLRRANSEAAKKERFLQYLTLVFSSDTGAQALISVLSLGAERTIANIPRGSSVRRGRADTQTETIIIEWEKDLAKTGEHAAEQLAEYLVGNWRSGQDYRFVLVATDGIRWRIYAPDWSHLEMGKFSLNNQFKLREIRKFDLSPESLAEFPFFLDEILFISRPKIATLTSVQGDFGDTSSTFINSMRALKECASAIEERSELQVAFEQWKTFLSIAYGRFDDSPEMFLVHTYLSVFAKLIAYAVIAKGPSHDEGTLRSILSGEVFESLNLERFVEDDFFHWVVSPKYFGKLRPLFSELNRQIERYDFVQVKEDILKGVYQELIDLDTRHALGEYYTPDWLCERMVERLPLNESSCVLDPACGSGSFLRALAARMKTEFSSVPANKISEQIVGIDIHPLSVQIAKTTMVLALGEAIAKSRSPVTLHVYLANSLLVPKQSADLFETTFSVSVDNAVYSLDISGLTKPEDFDRLISFCDDLVERYKTAIGKDQFAELAEKLLPKKRSKSLVGELHSVYSAMKRAKDAGRDSIWKFILQNTYKPIFLRESFDVVVGNPPWLTYAGVSNAAYQDLLRHLADDYAVTPVHRANMPHMEIAAIFLAHAVNYFLKPAGILAFVLPRSFLSADQHENTRGGLVRGVKVSNVWDMKDVEPLFRVPCCVITARRSAEELPTQRRIPKQGIPGASYAGRLPHSHLH